MASPISPIRSMPLPESIKPAGQSSSNEFRSMLQGAISGVEQTRQQANQSVDSFLAGDSQDVHTVALAVQRAELSFDLFMQVRNKVVSAYQEVMRMQL